MVPRAFGLGCDGGGTLALAVVVRWGAFVEWRWAGAVALLRDAHLSDDEAVVKMGHPEVGHPPRSKRCNGS